MTSEVSTTKLPVIDMGQLSILTLGLGQDTEPTQEEWQRVTRELYEAFTKFGCAYLTNHGIPEDELSLLYDSMAAFFNSESEKKNRYAFDLDTFEGYIALDTASYGSGTHELHEGLVLKTDGVVDEPEIPSFKPAVAASLKSYRALSNTIMTALSLSLGKDPDYLASLHKDRGTANSSTSMRVNYYPPVPATVPEGTTRFGAHRDFSTISFIVQDNRGGLQVQDTEGSWLDVNPIPGTIILLAGEFFGSYSGDKFIAPIHRVIISAEELQRSVPRISTNYFVHADNQVPFKLLDSSSTEKSMTVKEYLSSRIMKALNKSTKE